MLSRRLEAHVLFHGNIVGITLPEYCAFFVELWLLLIMTKTQHDEHIDYRLFRRVGAAAGGWVTWSLVPLFKDRRDVRPCTHTPSLLLRVALLRWSAHWLR